MKSEPGAPRVWESPDRRPLPESNRPPHLNRSLHQSPNNCLSLEDTVLTRNPEKKLRKKNDKPKPRNGSAPGQSLTQAQRPLTKVVGGFSLLRITQNAQSQDSFPEPRNPKIEASSSPHCKAERFCTHLISLVMSPREPLMKTRHPNTPIPNPGNRKDPF